MIVVNIDPLIINEAARIRSEWDPTQRLIRQIEEANARLGINAEAPAAPAVDLDNLLGLRTAGVVGAEVDAAPPRRWLFRRVWPADAYGVVGAKHKAGKSWLMLDAAVAAASGTPWLGTFEVDTPGVVLLFAGEGGLSKLTRRGRGVAASRGHRWDDLPILIAERVPHLTDPDHLAALRRAAETHQPVLIIIDPLYLAIGGQGDGRNLYAMGGVLEAAQLVAQDAGAALMVSHHNNRDETRKGSDRLSGAGPAEWGRVLISMDVKYDNADTLTGRTDVRFNLDVDGDEVTGGRHAFRRVIAADDPDDLTSPIRYDLTAVDDVADDGGPSALRGYSPAQRRVLAAIEVADGWVDVLTIGDRVAEDGAGSPLKKRTIQDAVKHLADDGMVRARPTEAGGRGAWRRLEEGVTDGS